MADIYDCEFYLRCKNNSRCVSCGPNQRLLSLPGDNIKKKYEQKQKAIKANNNDDDSWKELEQSVANDFNIVPNIKEARRVIRSGGIWFMPGDVADPIMLIECKDHGEETAKGEKTFGIKKDVLDKIIEEGRLSGKYPGLVFRYKGTEQRYAVQPFESLCDLVVSLKAFMHDNEVLTKERDYYKQMTENLIKKIEGMEQDGNHRT